MHFAVALPLYQTEGKICIFRVIGQIIGQDFLRKENNLRNRYLIRTQLLFC